MIGEKRQRKRREREREIIFLLPSHFLACSYVCNLFLLYVGKDGIQQFLNARISKTTQVRWKRTNFVTSTCRYISNMEKASRLEFELESMTQQNQRDNLLNKKCIQAKTRSTIFLLDKQLKSTTNGYTVERIK